ncbi:hypothetical protein F5Y14DRAFT_420284 [Nemania sp. NC0429]|nr:hypothetical protein F5Y14DRAFT_420284 [Nemania sp. NC0429]
MLLRKLVPGALVVSASLALAADPPDVNLNDIPQCGLTCIVNTVSENSTCAVTDFPCLCANQPLAQAIQSCITTHCAPRDALAAAGIVYNVCGVPRRDISLAVRLVPSLSIILSTIFYLLRLLSRSVLHQRVDISDIVLGVSVGFTFPILWSSWGLSAAGLGKDAWNISPDGITEIFYYYWWAELFYQGGLPLTRISFLCFYLGLFPQAKFRLACNILIGLNAANFIAFVIASIFQCYPIYGAWTFWDGSFTGHCNDVHIQSWIQAGINIAFDLVVVIMPLPLLSSLSTSLSRKIHIIIMFSLGFFITIISIIRLNALVVFRNSSNVSYDYVRLGLYSTIEACVGIICACLPTFRALLLTVIPNLSTLTTNRSKFSNSNPRRDQSSRQNFDRLEDSSVHDNPTSPVRSKSKWSGRSDDLFTDSQSASDVELAAMKVGVTGTRLESKPREGQNDDKQDGTTSWSGPAATAV